MRFPTIQFLAAGLGAACAACGARPSAAPRDVAGSCQPAFGSPVCTWAQMSGSQVVAVGATVPMTTIDSAPADAPMVWPPEAVITVPFPSDVRAAIGLDHLTLNWEPHGHPPAPFTTPHFDFHFYVISDSVRQTIDCSHTNKPATLPAGYDLPDLPVPGLGTLIGVCVPRMGMHSILATVAQDTAPFTATMVLGFYQGSPIFYEPMISRTMLATRRSFNLPVTAPENLPPGVRYPTRFEARYDATLPGYSFIFTGFPS